VTSIVLFLPLGVATIWMVGWSGGVAPQMVGAALAFLLHLAIVAAVAARYRSLAGMPSQLPPGSAADQPRQRA
jgi:hypothetical protein